MYGAGLIVKQFILFMYPTFYPQGGLNDLVDSFDTLEEATAYRDVVHADDDVWKSHWNIIDTKNGASYYGKWEED